MKTAIFSALALLANAGSATAAPRAPEHPPSVTVPYADLDLNQAKDAATMLKRIKRAATEVCRVALGYVENDADTMVWVNGCYRETVAQSVAGLNAPKVTEVFAGPTSPERLARVP